MDFLHVVTDSPERAQEIVKLLLKEKLALDCLTTEYADYTRAGDDKIEAKQVILIKARTKHLLFNTIDQRLREEFGADMPVLFSVPIVNMDWEQAQQLVSEIAKT